jgi:hypothetical protein
MVEPAGIVKVTTLPLTLTALADTPLMVALLAKGVAGTVVSTGNVITILFPPAAVVPASRPWGPRLKPTVYVEAVDTAEVSTTETMEVTAVALAVSGASSGQVIFVALAEVVMVPTIEYAAPVPGWDAFRSPLMVILRVRFFLIVLTQRIESVWPETEKLPELLTLGIDTPVIPLRSKFEGNVITVDVVVLDICSLPILMVDKV